MRDDKVEELFEEYFNEKISIELSLDTIRDELGDRINKIVLYGAGSAGIAFLYCLRDAGVTPLFFADGNSAKWGTYCEGLEVIDYRTIVDRAGKDALVIVTINTDGKRYCKSFDEALRIGGHGQVHKNLRDAGCKNTIDYTFFRRCHELFKGDPYNLPSCSDVHMMEGHKEDIRQVYEWLTDEKSKKVFADIVRFRMIDDSLTIDTEPQDNQYFENNLFSFSNEESFVDCGAFNGISLDTFLKRVDGRFNRYYGFEPDEYNYKLLNRKISQLQESVRNKCSIYNKACYDKEGISNLYSLKGPGSFISDIGKEKISTTTIDKVVGEGITYIKMNIEGSEIPALVGASETIKKNKPKLAIAGYHKTWDLWEIPKIIKELRTDYRLYLRSYMNHISFVYYGE